MSAPPTLSIDQTNAHQRFSNMESHHKHSPINYQFLVMSIALLSHPQDSWFLDLEINVLKYGEFPVNLWRLCTTSQVMLKVKSSIPIPKYSAGHQYSVNSVSVSPGGTLVCSGSTDGTSLLWDTRSGGAVGSLLQPSGAAVRVVSFSPGHHLVATAGDDEEVCLWDVSRGGDCVKRITGHQATVFAVTWSPDGDLLVSSDTEGRVRVWSAVMGHSERLAGVEEAHDLGVTSLCFSPTVARSSLTSEYSLVTCGNDGSLALWSIVAGVQPSMTLTKRVPAHQGAAMAVAVSADGQLVCSAGGDKLVKLWSPDLTLLHELSGHARYVTSVAFSRCGQYLASGSNDKSIKLWSFFNDSVTTPSAITSSSHQSRSETLLQSRLSQCQQRTVQTLSSHSQDVTSCDLGGQYLVTGCSDALVRVWQYTDQQQYRPVTTLTGHTYSVYSVRLASDNTTVVSASLDGVVILWTLPTGELTRSWRHPDHVALRVVRLSGDNNVVAVGGDDDLVHVWHLDSDSLTQLSWHDNTILALAFNNDDDLLAVGCSGGSLSLWSLTPPVASAPVLTMSACHDLGVTGLEWSSDNRLVSVGQDGLIKLWSLAADHRQLTMLQAVSAHPTTIMSLAMARDKSMLVTSSGDKTCKLWSADTLQCEAVLGPESSYVTCAAVDTDTGMVLLGVETRVHVYRVPPPHNKPSLAPHWPGIEQWSSNDIQQWLSLLDIDEETLKLLENINGEELGSLSRDSLLRIGVDERVASRLVDEIALICDSNDDGAPNKFVCPITCDLMVSPVQCSDGFIYEENAIKVKIVEAATKIFYDEKLFLIGMVGDAEKYVTLDQSGVGQHTIDCL